MLAPISLPNLSFITRKTDRLKDKCNAEDNILAYTTVWRLGWWSEGDVTIPVVAVIEWRKSASGSLASMMLQSSVAADIVPGTYLYNRIKPRRTVL
jgi:hypothetical protein